MKRQLRILVGLVAMAAVIFGASAAMAQNECNATWDTQNTTVGLHILGLIAIPDDGGGSGGQNTIDLEDGHLPQGHFDDDVANWDELINNLPFISDEDKAQLIAGVNAFYEDLEAGINETLDKLPSRIVMNRYRDQNWLEKLLKIIPIRIIYVTEDGNTSQYSWVNYSCDWISLGVLAVNGGFDTGWLAVAIAPWIYGGRPGIGTGNYSVDLWFFGLIQDVFAIFFDVGIHGEFTLTRL